MARVSDGADGCVIDTVSGSYLYEPPLFFMGIRLENYPKASCCSLRRFLFSPWTAFDPKLIEDNSDSFRG
jgi:hypothetical protein